MKLNVRTEPKTQEEKQACEFIVAKAIKNNIKSAREILVLQKRACEKYKTDFVTNPMLLATYQNLVKSKKIKVNPLLFELLRKRRIRTSSGIASVAVLTKPYKCPGECIYCPNERGMPKSYLSNEPAVMRANMVRFDPIKQIFVRLRGLEIAGNPADKIELIIMGGTFSYLPRAYQLKFIISCFWACNNYQTQNAKLKTQNNNLKLKTIKLIDLRNKTKSGLLQILDREQKKNEKAKCRIVGLTLETRPDYIDEKEIKWFRRLGCTRVEIGVQSIYDHVLDKNNRGHKVVATINATKLLKDAGFKVCYHLMPNLYGSNKKLDLQMFKDLFSKSAFQPDMIKIYPCVLTANSELEKLYHEKKLIPYTDVELIKLLIDIKRALPEYVRLQRLYRDIPAESILAGSKISNIRQIIQNRAISDKRYAISKICKCIRCREIREDTKLPINLKRIDYRASGGKEVFLQYVDKNNRLYALLRLRIPSTSLLSLTKWKSGSETFRCGSAFRSASARDRAAIIREVHTFGQMVRVGDKNSKNPQHRGLGRKLIKKTEQIAKQEFGLKKIAAISGVGARDYYRKLGYRLDGTYMIKTLKPKSKKSPTLLQDGEYPDGHRG